MNHSVLGSLIVLPFFGLLVYGLLMGIPYVYNRMTTPWAGTASSDKSLLGTWVGQLGGAHSTDYEAFLKAGGRGVPSAAAAPPTAMQLAIHMEFTWGVPKVKGTAVVCEAGGKQKTYTYKLAWIQDPTQFSLSLRPAGEPSVRTELIGHFSPGSLQVEMPGTHASKAGALHKGTADQFNALCSRL